MSELRMKNGYAKGLTDFMKAILVRCPSCAEQACVNVPNGRLFELNKHDLKLTCSSCGYNKRYDEKLPRFGYLVRHSVDPFFLEPLWLSANCCGSTLWAYNYEHLSFMRDYVEANLRERNTVETSNKSMASRFPKWIASKKNRGTVLKSIARLMKV